MLPVAFTSAEAFSIVGIVPTCFASIKETQPQCRSHSSSSSSIALGKDEALRRMQAGLSRAKTEFAWLLSLEEEVWTGDRLTFRASALGQRAVGRTDEDGKRRLDGAKLA